MSDFKLDVDAPYPIPSHKILEVRPDRMEYPHGKITRKHYGKNIEHSLEALKTIEDEEAKTQIAANIAKYMRAKAFEYNQEHPNNEVIMKDIRSMSDNMVTIDEVALNNLRNDYKQPRLNNRAHKGSSGHSNNGKSGGFANNKQQGNKRRQNKSSHNK